MRVISFWQLPALAVAGLLVAAGALLVFGMTAPGCYPGVEKSEETPITRSSVGETNMPITHNRSQVQHADDTTFRNLVLQSDVPVLVDFYADWCGPCQRLAPVLEELAAETSGARIVKVNVDHSPRLAAEYGIDSIPSLMVFRNGAVTDQLVGLASKSQLRTLLTR